ncbi:MAG: nucleotidyl transferase AbiEii/AbiGii toxin family protein [Myxococcota bacterium]
MTREYRTAAAFRQALEQRLRTASTSGVDFARRRQLVVFDRFLARIALELGDAVTLKGGLAVELRIERARTTTDVDLRVMGAPDDILARLDASAKLDLGDFMVFSLQPHARHPEIQNDGMQYDGVRFRAECSLAGKVYARPFGVDVAIGDPILGEPEVMVADDALAFAGIAPPTLRVYPVETHVAEKLHAYTMPRARPNSRVKDLPDLAPIATAGAVEAGRLRAAIDQTFYFRGTHAAPGSLPAPPDTWERPYATIAKEDQLRWSTLAEAFEAARAFLHPVLAGHGDASWDPSVWTWVAAPGQSDNESE